MKSYKFEYSDKTVIKVRFYNTGCYSVVDKNGEHEVGQWRKVPMRIGKDLSKESKDKNSVTFQYAPFDKSSGHREGFGINYIYQSEMAHTIAMSWYHTHKK